MDAYSIAAWLSGADEDGQYRDSSTRPLAIGAQDGAGGGLDIGGSGLL
jgi:hypothetical protein